MKDKLNNGGYSLVELLVVIGIIGALIAVASFGLPLMFSKDANSAAVQIDDELAEVRMLSMSRDGQFTFILHTDTDPKANYIQINRTYGTPSTTEVFRTVKIDKSVEIVLTGNGITSTAGNDIVIEFDKAKGCVKYVDTANPPTSAASGVYSISVTSKRNPKTKVVTLVTDTGRHYTDK